jgi:hypothetical protein
MQRRGVTMIPAKDIPSLWQKHINRLFWRANRRLVMGKYSRFNSSPANFQSQPKSLGCAWSASQPRGIVRNKPSLPARQITVQIAGTEAISCTTCDFLHSVGYEECAQCSAGSGAA